MAASYENPIPKSERSTQLEAAMNEFWTTFVNRPAWIQASSEFDDNGLFVQRITTVGITDLEEVRDEDGNIIREAWSYSQEELDAFMADLRTRYPLAF